MNKKILAVFVIIIAGVVAQFSIAQANNSGSLTVCVINIDKDNHIIRDFNQITNTKFTIPITTHDNGVATVIRNVTFTTDTFSPNTQIVGLSNDAECKTYNLPISDYYYRREIIEGTKSDLWEKALYNDEYTSSIKNIHDFFELGTPDDADHTIVLHDDRPDRRLVILNQFKGEPTPPPAECKSQDGITLGLTQVKTLIGNGKIKVSVAIDSQTNRAIGTIVNDTDCNVPASLVTYKMFDRTLGTQEFFDYAPDNKPVATVLPHSTTKIETRMPDCMSQTDLYYGPGPRTLFNDNRSEEITLAFNFNQNTGGVDNASGNFCHHPVTTPTPPAFTLICTPAQSSLLVGQSATFTASTTGGTGHYIFSWSGDGNSTSTTSTTSIIFATLGTKNVAVTATSGVQVLRAQCVVDVQAQPTTCTNCGGGGGSIGGGGSFGGGGGSGYISGVTVTRSTPALVGGVYLSQVPYTGIGSNLKVALFIFGLLSWSIWISYLIIKRKARKNGLTINQIFTGIKNPSLAYVNNFQKLKEKIRTSIPIMTNIPTSLITLTPYEPKKIESGIISPFIHETKSIQPVTKEAVVETLEKRAHELETLVSADGLEIIVKASQNNKNNAIIILNHLVALYKGAKPETANDWLALNTDKIKIIF